MQLFYVDRVRHKDNQLVQRRFPGFKGWTTEKLKLRQKLEVKTGQFGTGNVLKALREALSEDTQDTNTQPSQKVNKHD